MAALRLEQEEGRLVSLAAGEALVRDGAATAAVRARSARQVPAEAEPRVLAEPQA